MRLLDDADVLIDNFRPGVIEAMGFGYEALRRATRASSTCSISGFGSTGPLRDYPGFDQIAQGMSGLMSVTGTAESGPTRVGIAICDLLGGIFSAQGILLALEARHRTGRGQRVETSLLESIVSILSWSAGIYFDTGKTPGPGRQPSSAVVATRSVQGLGSRVQYRGRQRADVAQVRRHHRTAGTRQ